MRMGAFGRAVYNSRHRARVQSRQIVPAFEALGGSLAGCRVLEIGAGRGIGSQLVLDTLEAARVDALDLDPVMARLASRRFRERALNQRGCVIIGDSTALPFPSGVYDAVVGIGAIHLADAWKQIILEIARVLRPRGRFLFEQPVTPVPRWTVQLPGGACFPGGFDRTDLLDTITRSGLDIVGTTRRGIGKLDLIGMARKTG
jgi:SAM-dependent methyltransferase